MKKLEVTVIDKLPVPNIKETGIKPLTMTRPKFGDIRVDDGWLYNQLEAMTSGLTGRLYEFGPCFRPAKDGFLDPDVACGWEEIPYWLRGAYPLAVITGNKRLLGVTKKYIEALIESQEEDGWFGPRYLKSFETTPDGLPVPDFFPYMLLLDPIILYYEYEKDERVLALMEKFFRFALNVPDKAFLPAHLTRIKWQKFRAGDMLPSIYWYYRKTGNEWVLPLAERFHKAIWKCDMKYVAHHAVDFAQRFAYDAVYSQQSGDPKDFEASVKAYDDFKETWGQMPRGIFAADEQIREGCVDPRQGYEPCGMVELAKNFYELSRISGDTLYADRTEDVMLNHFAPSYTKDYKQLHYLTCANLPKMSRELGQPTTNGSFGDAKSYEMMTPNNRCCGHNTGMGWPYYAMNLWQKTADGGIAAWLYATSEITTDIVGKTVSLEMKTDYPFRENLTVTVKRGAAFPLYFRIPGWSRGVTVTVNGKKYFDDDKKGLVGLTGLWRAGDVITVAFKAEISYTKWKNGSVSVDYGPFTYSLRLPEKWMVVQNEDSAKYAHPTPHIFENLEAYTDAAWNYGLDFTGDINDCVRVVSHSGPVASQPFDEAVAPTVLAAKVRKINEWGLEDHMAGELGASPAYTEEPVEEVRLIPLGCARLRISCFPTVTDDKKTGHRWTPTPEHTAPETRTPKYPTPYTEDPIYKK